MPSMSVADGRARGAHERAGRGRTTMHSAPGCGQLPATVHAGGGGGALAAALEGVPAFWHGA